MRVSRSPVSRLPLIRHARWSHRSAHAVFRSRLHFASPAFVGCIKDLPTPDCGSIRAAALEALAEADTTSWSTDPVTTVVKGQTLTDGSTVDTFDAFGNANGKMVHATAAEVDAVIEHLRTNAPAYTPQLRDAVRAVEAELLSECAGTLIANQALDFGKQDGITEIEEALQANTVERRLNDQLIAEEAAGRVLVGRQPAFVGCVSNFSNFLDLCRKVLRNLELGVPIVALSRNNTTQHMYRWFQMLTTRLQAHGVDPAMTTYLSCSIDEQRRVFAAFPDSPLYFTGSRPIAQAIKSLLPKTFASTGGPNTMVALEWNEGVRVAAQQSLLIENSGQCTALRHLVVPQCSPADVESMFTDAPVVADAGAAIKSETFGAMLRHQTTGAPAIPAGYTATSTPAPVKYRIGSSFPPEELDEHWRQPYMDVTVPEQGPSHPDSVADLAKWLVKQQPITLAINGDASPGYPVATALFERTAQVVYTVGAPGAAALTAQARPQEGEIFGEFPPRHQLTRFTKFPVTVPSSTPGYNSVHSPSFLRDLASAPLPTVAKHVEPLMQRIESAEVKGYANHLVEYLVESCGPKPGIGARTSLFGLQRPPLDGSTTVIRCGPTTRTDELLLHLLPFVLTNAHDQVAVSCHPSNQPAVDVLESLASEAGVRVSISDDETSGVADVYNTVYPAQFDPMLVGHFVSILFPLGHIKSTLSNDQTFLDTFTRSAKWLAIRSM